VSEIATMALDLLSATSQFKVPHSQNETVQIRIGIHTGSCGAGISANQQSFNLTDFFQSL
jgi:class 3 adenylate cyclase